MFLMQIYSPHRGKTYEFGFRRTGGGGGRGLQLMKGTSVECWKIRPYFIIFRACELNKSRRRTGERGFKNLEKGDYNR